MGVVDTLGLCQPRCACCCWTKIDLHIVLSVQNFLCQIIFFWSSKCSSIFWTGPKVAYRRTYIKWLRFLADACNWSWHIAQWNAQFFLRQSFQYTKPRTMDAQWSLFSLKSRTFGIGQTNWADTFWGIWGIFGQTISTQFVTVSPLSMFSIIQPLLQQKTRPLYPHPKYLFGLGFEFGPQRNRDFDRVFLALESRDLSQADKSITRESSFPSFNFWLINYSYSQKNLFGKIVLVILSLKSL